MTPRISIITPCYNGEKYLRETLDCLQKQTIDDWECIIVNDGSTDGSLEIMKEYAAKDPRYKYIDKQNEGPAVARNVGIAASCGKYILPLDADDLIAPSYTEKAIAYLEEHDDCKLVYCRCELFGDIEGPCYEQSYDYETMLFDNMLFNACVFRRSDFDKTSGYNPNMRGSDEDWDFWISLIHATDQVYRIPEFLFFYRMHSCSRSKDLYKERLERNTQMILNHLDVYKPYLGNLIIWRKERDYYEQELYKISNSKKYKFGVVINILLKFFR